MFFPKSKAKITDTWQVIGLRGTGSDDYEVNDLFVPEAYSFTRESDADRRETGPLYLLFHLQHVRHGVLRGRARHRPQRA